MSRSAAAAAARHDRQIRHPARPAAPRRVSGPVAVPRDRQPRARARALPAPRRATVLVGGARAVAGGGVAIASRAAGLALDVSASRAMDRVVRSRAWIVILGIGLIGIVAMQVSMLKLNSGIGRAVDASATLDRSNAGLRLQISRLSATDRVQRLAADGGFVMPLPDDVAYLHAGSRAGDARRAARTMTAPASSNAAATPTAAAPAAPQPDSAVLATAPGAAPQATTAPSAPAATAAATATAATSPTAAPAAAAPPPASGGTNPETTASGGAVPPPTGP